MLKPLSYMLSFLVLGMVAYSAYSLTTASDIPEKLKETQLFLSLDPSSAKNTNLIDPWDTPYRSVTTTNDHALWSAGPDKKFQEDFKQTDDVLVLAQEYAGVTSPVDVLAFFNKNAVRPLALILLNSQTPKLQDAAQNWADKMNLTITEGTPWTGKQGLVFE